MNIRHFIALLALLLPSAANAQDQGRDSALNPSLPVLVVRSTLGQLTGNRVLWDQCGGEGERACILGDPSYPLLPEKLPGFHCDRALTPQPAFPAINGVPMRCLDTGVRHSSKALLRLDPTLGGQQTDQHRRISADLPMNLVPTMGTHNSYSNAIDGTQSLLNRNQVFTISDQLYLGARHLRLDPMGDLFRHQLCHMSPDLYKNVALNLAAFTLGVELPKSDLDMCSLEISKGGWLGGRLSYNRPFYLALREIRHWLDQNPDEVIYLIVNNYWGIDKLPYIPPAELEAVILHELGPKLHRYDGVAAVWPTHRQVQTAGAQILVSMAQTGPEGFAWPFALGGDSAANVTPSSDGFEDCDPRGTTIGISTTDGHLAPELIGEGRTMGDRLAGASNADLLTAFKMQTAVFCGFGRLSMDYFYGLNAAPKVGIPATDYTDGFDEGCVNCDDRPKKMIWSWNLGEFPVTGKPASLKANGPVINDMYPATQVDALMYRWTQASESTNLPYACAGPQVERVIGYHPTPPPPPPFPNPANGWLYDWKITSKTGPWSEGEKACQEFSPLYHFWRPMSSPENRALIDMMKSGLIGQVWLNHMPGKTVALAPTADASFDSRSAFKQSVVLSSGFGGRIGVEFLPANSGTPTFVTVTPTAPGVPLFTIEKAANLPSNLAPGTYVGSVRFTEYHGDGTVAGASDVRVSMIVANTPAFVLSTSSVSFVNGLTQVVNVTSSSPGTEIPFHLTLPQGSSWLTISANNATTPAQLTFTAVPQLAPRVGTATLGIVATNGVTLPANVNASINTVTVTLAMSPTADTMQVDGQNVTTPATRTWVLGSTHTVAAPANFISGNSTYAFLQWQDGVTTAARTVAPTVDANLTANYSTRHRLLLSVSPANGGAAAAQDPSADGFYPAGSAVTINATPSAGFVFKQFTGDSTSLAAPAVVIMNAPKSVQAVFVPAQGRTTFTTAPSGLQIVVDGTPYSTPVSFTWAPAETHSVSAPIQAGQRGGRFVFTGWADAGNTANPRTFGGSSTDVAYTAQFATQYLVTANVVPAASGALSGSGWYAPNTPLQFQATAAPGFRFVSLSGGVTSASTPVSATVTGPLTVTANFAALGTPLLYASSTGRTDLGNEIVAVPIVLNNLGSGPAPDVAVYAIENIQVPQGGGAVSAVLPPGGLLMGTIPAGAKGTGVVNFKWPTTAARVTFTVRYRSLIGSTYAGSNTISLYR